MSLTAGTRLGPYEIIAPIGAGGMGEVYRARDTRLDRDVAIKVLPQLLANDAARRERFEREAKAVAALSHPNIINIFDTGLHEGHPYVVMELLEGGTLRDTLVAAALPVRKAVEIAVQIARGLGAAHDKQIVHRDLKPENVFVLRDGQVKILDFGLAKASVGSAAVDATETRAAITDAGTAMGTVGYMAPEQIRAQPVDGRTDLFAFGAVLFEMLSGTRAFQRETSAETMTAILKDDVPDLTSTNAQIPPALERIVRHCLEKSPAERFQSARDVAFALEALSGTGVSRASGAAAVVTSSPRRWTASIGTAAVIGLLAATPVLLGIVWLIGWPPPWRAAPSSAPVSLHLTPLSFEQGGQTGAVWSPDGKGVAFGARQKNTDPFQVYVRYLDSPVATEITHVPEGATVFEWTSTGHILFTSTGSHAGIWSVSPVGGEPEPYPIAGANGIVRARSVTKDGTAAAVLMRSDDGVITVWTAATGSPLAKYEPAPFATKNLRNTPSVKFSPDGKQIMVVLNSGEGEEAWLMPYPADPANPPRRILQRLPTFENTPTFCWMPDSRRVVLAGSPPGQRGQLYIGDTVSGVVAMFSSGTTPQGSPAVSPDGKRLVFLESVTDRDIVSVDLATSVVTPLIATQRSEQMPAWAVKDAALVYVTDRNANLEIWIHRAGQPDRPLVTARDFPPDTTRGFMAPALSPDASRVIYTRLELNGGVQLVQLWMSAIAGGPPVPLLTNGGGRDYSGAWSPDGNWFVYRRIADGESSVLKVKTTGQAEPQLLARVKDLGGLTWVPLWSPTGDWIAYPSHEGLMLIAPDGHSPRELSPISSLGVAFSADGRTLYGMRQTPRTSGVEIFAINVASGAEKTIASIGLEYLPSTSLTPSLRLALSPDGKSLTYSTSRLTANLWLMDGLETVTVR